MEFLPGSNENVDDQSIFVQKQLKFVAQFKNLTSCLRFEDCQSVEVANNVRRYALSDRKVAHRREIAQKWSKMIKKYDRCRFVDVK